MDLANDGDAYTIWVYYYRMRKSMSTFPKPNHNR